MTEATDLTAADNDQLAAAGLPPAFTAEELAEFLTPAEIKALNEDGDPLFDAADDLDEDDGEGDAPAAQAADDADNPPAVQPEAAPAPVDEPQFQPTDVSAHQAALDGAAAERKALRTAYTDGDLSDEEYDAQLDALAEKVADAKAEIKAAERADASSLQAVAEVWYTKTAAFMETNPAFADQTPRADLQGNSMLRLFDAALRQVSSNPQFQALPMDQRISIGARMVSEHVKTLTGQDVAAPTAPKKAAKPAAAPQVETAKELARKQGRRPDPVQTLANVTAATETDLTDGRFAALDGISDAMDAEAAFDRMSAAEQAAYLRGAR